mgnify:CR=1 FL=1
MKSALFQSLSRDSGRLNYWYLIIDLVSEFLVSIPQSGFGAFEHLALRAQVAHLKVSIPQSGFEAFEPIWRQIIQFQIGKFQSLSRDSGRLNTGPKIPDETATAICFNPSVGIRGV